MTIVDLLKLTASATHVSCGYQWIYYDDLSRKWVVTQHFLRKMPKIIIETESESEAVAAFCEAAGIEVIE